MLNESAHSSADPFARNLVILAMPCACVWGSGDKNENNGD